MRIAVEASCWALHRGYGRHLRGLMSAFAGRYPEHEVVLVSDTPSGDYAVPPGASWVDVPTGRTTLAAASAESSRSAADMWRVSQALTAVQADVILFPTVYSFVPVMSRTPVAVFIHDVIAESFPEAVFSGRGAERRWRAKVWLARRSSSQLITVSHYTRSKIAQALRVREGAIAVVGEAPDSSFRRLSQEILPMSLQATGVEPRRRHIVYVGGFGPHKNLSRLLDAVGRLVGRAEYRNLQLVLVGDPERDGFLHEWETIQNRVEELGDHAVLAGFLPDEELVQLLNVATLLVLPSYMEGYGLPAVEAAACGCAVAATEESAAPEVFGNAAVTFPPGDTAAIEAALIEALDQAQWLGHAGWERVRSLSWERAAEDLEQVLRGLAAS